MITAGDFVAAVTYSVGRDAVQPAFLALRVAVNDELGEVARGLDAALVGVRSGGAVHVVVYHSAETEVMMNVLRQWGWEGEVEEGRVGRGLGLGARGGLGGSAGRHAQVGSGDVRGRRGRKGGGRVAGVRAFLPSDAEISENPRARSAILYEIAV